MCCENTDRCLTRNAAHRQARHLKVVLLRLLDRQDEAKSLVDHWLSADRFQPGLVHEQFKDEHNRGEDAPCFRNARWDDQHSCIELALDYAAAGLYNSAAGVLEQYLQSADQQPETAIVLYLLADWYGRVGDDLRAEAMLQQRGKLPA